MIELFFLFFVLFCFFTAFLLANKLIKKTNWFRNQFQYAYKLQKKASNLEIVNLGSNPARFAFFYEKINGENWSAGTQGLDIDYEILKVKYSQIRKGGFVLFPIVAFSSVSKYLDNKPEYCSPIYYAKYVPILGQNNSLLKSKMFEIERHIKFPLFYSPMAFKYLFKDIEKDKRLECTDLPLEYNDLNADASKWIEGWKAEFGISDLEDELSPALKLAMKDSASVMRENIDFAKSKQLQPFIIFPPMSSPLSIYFTEKVKQNYIYDFIKMVNRQDVAFLDYSNHTEFNDPSLYFNALFMNLRGRKLFTNNMLRRLGLNG